MPGSIGPLLPADEYFNHQIIDTFATVAQSDLAWTEKVCGMAAAKDGSLQIGFGFGKYTNRNVVDAYAGVSRGVEQWTVRASRELADDPDSVSVGPIHYEILEPLHAIRVWLENNNAQAIAFDITFKSIVPCVVEHREDRRSISGYRKATDQVRFHQTGTAAGWVEVDGQRQEISSSDWIATRDHSWGVRPAVGVPPTDMAPDISQDIPRVLAIWNPIYFQPQDAEAYAFHQYFLHFSGPGFKHEVVQGGFEYPDGRRDLIASLRPELRFNPKNKRLLGGKFHLQMADGSERMLSADAMGDTGFHLGAGLYHGYDGKYHGSWRGKLHLEGDYHDDCASVEQYQQLNQFRDCMIRVSDEGTGATGWGNCQTHIDGSWPQFCLE
ncbi:MAG: hypothetical protein ACR2PS_11340 [Pseudomonadales bacterium]